MLLCLSSCLSLLLPHFSTFRTCISFYRLSCDTWDRNSTIMELNRAVLWLHCCWRWCCLCEESHNAHIVAQVKRVSRAHLFISGRQNVAYFSAHASCVCVCDKMFNLMARGINNLQLQLLPVRHTHTHILTVTPTHWHSVIKLHLLVCLFSLPACFVGQSKVSPTSLQSFVIPISQRGKIYDDLNSLQFTYTSWSKKFLTNTWWIRAWGVRFL